MRISLTTLTLVAGAGLLAEAAVAQCIYKQPWTPPRASHESRVLSCADPTPLNLVAVDDFVCENGGQLRRVRWAGVLFDAEQRYRPFYIAIHPEIDCLPGAAIATACVVPKVRRLGLDCEDNRVFAFSAGFPNGPVLNAGQRYWIQIAEIDASSANPQVEDFRWSAHRPIEGCFALNRDAQGNLNLLIDNCDQERNDLAFSITTRAIVGDIGIVDPSETTNFLARLVNPSGEIVASESVTPDEAGAWEWWPGAPNGTYQLELHGMGAKVLTSSVVLQDDSETQADLPDVILGDLNGDNSVSLTDLAIILSNFGL